MKIAQVLLSPRVGGAESLVRELAIEWNGAGIDSRVFYVDTAGSTAGRIERRRALRRSIRSYRPDVILAHTATPNIYARLAAPWRTPVAIVIHSAQNDYASGILRHAEKVLRYRTALVVAVSEDRMNEYREDFGLVPRSIVIANGISDPTATKGEYSKTAINVITMARLSMQKAPQLWVEATKLCPDMQFTWFGPTSDSEASQIVLAGAASIANAHYGGKTDRPLDLMASADVLFHPASRESQGLVLIEAASIGLPVVCAEHIDAALPFRVAAATFEAGQAESARSALQDVTRRYGEVAEHAREIAGLVRARYSIKKTAADYLHELQQLTQ